MKLRVFTAFSGYDSQCMALDRIGVDYELVGWSEIDKYAIQAHNAVYPQWADSNYGDISEIDWDKVPDSDLFTMSSPCQDFSCAGLQMGGDRNSGTRSSLLWECDYAIRKKKPKYILFENVPALVSSKFARTFNEWQSLLASYGYSNYVQCLNAKDYGVAQSRNRVFMVSILDCDKPYYFPKPFKLTKRLRDYLEQEVDEKYYLSEKMIQFINSRSSGGFYRGRINTRLAELLMSGKIDYGYEGAIYLNAYNQTAHKEITGTIRARINASYLWYVLEPAEMDKETKIRADTDDVRNVSEYRVRRLTSRECFRLMNVDEENIDKIQSADISETQQYKMAGNSIVVNVLAEIFRKLFIDTEPDDGQQLKLF